MEDVITWLHVSDWHHGHKGKLDRRVVRDALIDDISAQVKNRFNGQIDFLIFSGDLAFRGTPDEYELATVGFLEPLRLAAGVPKSHLVFVPGNHDLDRSRLQFGPSLQALFKDRTTVAEAFEDSDVRKHLLFPMHAYSQCISNYLGQYAPAEPSYSFRHHIESVRNRKVAILGLNSAWMCGQILDPMSGDINDYGRLVLGEHQFRGLLTAIKREQPKPDLVIAVMHHPFWWLNEVENRSQIEDEMIGSCHFILRGHEHRSNVSVPTGSAGNCAIISAGAAYDRRDFPNGYSFVKLDFREGRGHVYVRRYYDELRQFSRDIVVAQDQEMVTFTLPKELSRPASRERRSTLVGDPWKVQSPATMDDLTAVYEKQHQVIKLPYLRVAVIVEANSLSKKSQAPDLVTMRVEFETPDQAIYCHRTTVMWAEGSEYQGGVSWSVTGPPGEIKTIAIPVSPRDNNRRDLLLFFIPVLQPHTGPYTLEKREQIADSMKPLREKGSDDLYVTLSRASGVIPRVDLVLKVPDDFGGVTIGPGSRKGAFDKGEEVVSPDELKQYGSPGFRTYCWRAQNVPEGKLVAADIRTTVSPGSPAA